MLVSQNSSFSPHMCICLLWQWVLLWLPWKGSWIWPQISGSKTGLFSKPTTVLPSLKLGVTWTGSESSEYSYFPQSEAFPSGSTESLKWHHCRSSCPAPLLRAMSCWVLSISKDRDFTASLHVFFQYWWPSQWKSVELFFFCVFWVIFWVINKLFPDVCVPVHTRWTVQEAAHLLLKLHSLTFAFWSKTRGCISYLNYWVLP